MKNQKTAILVEGALMLAMAAALSMLTPFQRILPFGGSITIVSMLPICLFSIRHGVKNGVMLSSLFSFYQLGEGIIKEGLLGWGLTPLMLIGCILFDYIIAFSVIGLAGIFRDKGKTGCLAGIVLALGLRYLSHFISGVVIFASTGKIWDELDFVASNKFIYSAVYNGAFMLPEILFTVLVTAVLLAAPQTNKLLLTPKTADAAQA
ncbi:MAG: energy-coupled thiamine transporter ThiT [Oscillospiraceae bacterium]|nr:energy-coupled thiamine transporter ThiT [Oscillospiraceae bacterium]